MPYRPTERTEARKAATRERIVAAALDQLAEGGYASAGVQAVAARAGVATGTLYKHFPSKADLFAEVFRRASQREVDVLAGMSHDLPVAERLAAGAEAFARRALAEPARAWALLAEPVDPAVEAERLVFRRAYRDVFAAALAEGVESGELRPHDTETLAAALVGAIAEALVGPLSSHTKSDALVVTIVDICVNALPTTEARVAA
ncbi:MAG: TetR/AcrR family transcriptional regulator [Thermoleophilaceae bacterium]|nr:TetR/AcrR family transcriptional regulator [Thermoleophilaceae bacterium]